MALSASGGLAVGPDPFSAGTADRRVRRFFLRYERELKTRL